MKQLSNKKNKLETYATILEKMLTPIFGEIVTKLKLCHTVAEWKMILFKMNMIYGQCEKLHRNKWKN